MSAPAETLFVDLDGVPVFAAAEVFAGRTVIGAHQGFDNGALQLRHNDRFADRVFAWLAGGVPWLTSSVDTGSVAGASSTLVPLEVDASGLDGGSYFARLFVFSNDPVDPVVEILLQLDVTPTPDIEVAATVSFAPLYTGFSQIQPMTIANRGNDTLFVTGAVVSHPDFSIDRTSFTIPQGGTDQIVIRCEPSSEGLIEGALTLQTNDFDEPVVDVILTAEGIGPPGVALTADSIPMVLPADTSGIREVRLSNAGGDTIWFYLSPLGNPDTTSVVSAPGLATTSGADESLPPHETGGVPAGFPVRAARPVAPAPSATFSEDFDDGDLDGWQDGGGAGTRQVTGTTTGGGSPYSYHEYGASSGHYDGIYQILGAIQPRYIRFWVRSDDSAEHDTYFVLRDSAGREVIWFFTLASGHLYINANVGGHQSYPYEADEWYLVELANIDFSTKTFDYRVNGAVVQSSVPFRNAADVQDLYRLDLYNYLAGTGGWWDEIRISSGAPAGWLSASPASGTVPPGGYVDITLTFDSNGLSEGSYEGGIELQSNAPAEPFEWIGCRLDVDSTATVTGGAAGRRTEFALGQSYPNPFNPETVIRFEIQFATHVRIDVYDVRGRHVRRLVDGILPSGQHSRLWDGRDDRGSELASGVYFYRLTAGGRSFTRKAVLLK